MGNLREISSPGPDIQIELSVMELSSSLCVCFFNALNKPDPILHQPTQ